jgi:hypothetical protein
MRHLSVGATLVALCLTPLAAQQNNDLIVRVLDQGTKPPRPIAGAMVWLGKPDPNDPGTDGDGRWQRKGLPAGKPVIVMYRKNKYINDPQPSGPLVPDGMVHELYLRRPDEDDGYYVQIASQIKYLAGRTSTPKKKEVFAAQWAELLGLPDSKLKIVGVELTKGTPADDLLLIPRDSRNLLMLDPNKVVVATK